MRFINSHGEAAEPDARERVRSHLQSLGVRASTADRGRPEEEICAGEFSSEGLIEISRGPISWINVLTRRNDRGPGRLVYGMTASDLPPVGEVQIWPIRVRSFPLFGWFVDIRWESFTRLPHELRSLDEDTALKRLMVKSLRADLEIRSHPSRGYWVMWVRRYGPLHLPSLEEWECYQAIASALLRSR